MAIVTLGEFRALLADETERVICAENLSAAALALETGTVVLEQVSRVRKSVSVEVPDADVRFNVKVSPEAAITAGCVALPETFVVAAGKEVILQAVPPAAGGYSFLGWFRGLVELSTDPIASIAIQAPAPGAIADEIVAKFQLIP